ncbi:choice-of-anchor D domain-containing protein [Roseibacillus persicicus]|uniref:choice-of-anchor D domain-containing protein n=1 Tax=Roseibacillus persicicus TaxID=454148 RepID=UPI00398A9FF3
MNTAPALCLAIFLGLLSSSFGQLISLHYDFLDNDIPYTPPSGPLTGSTPAAENIGTDFRSSLGLGQEIRHTFSLTNIDSEELRLSLAVTDANFRVSPSVASVGPGKTLSVSVTFAPQGFGEFSGTVQITRTNGADQPFHFEVEGGTTPGGPITLLSPEGIEISPLDEAANSSETIFTTNSNLASEQKTFVLRNDGAETLELTLFGLSTISITSSNEVTLAPGATADVRLRIPASPSLEPGTYDSELFIGRTLDGSPTPRTMATFDFRAIIEALPVVELERVRNDGTIQEMPTPLQMGSFEVGTESPAQTLRLSNEGNASLTINGLASDDATFVVSGLTFPTILAPGEETDFEVRFTPDRSGLIDGTLQLNSAELGLTDIGSLRGSGLVASVFWQSGELEDRDFDEEVGDTLIRTFTINNPSQLVPLRIDSISILNNGEPATDFTIGDFPAELPTQGTAQLEITYAPRSVVTSRSVQLVIVANVENGESRQTFTQTAKPKILPIDSISIDGEELVVTLPAYSQYPGGLAQLVASNDLENWNFPKGAFIIDPTTPQTYRLSDLTSFSRRFYRAELIRLAEE